MSHLSHFGLEIFFARLLLRDLVRSLAVRYAQGLKVGGNNGFPQSLSSGAQGKSDSLQILHSVADDPLLARKPEIVCFLIN